MIRQHTTGRLLVSRKLAGVIFAVFALFIQPLVALDVPSAFAATSNIAKLVFTNPPISVEQNIVTNQLTVQVQNVSSAAESLDTAATKLKLSSTSTGGQFSSNGTSGWTSAPSFTMASGSSSRSFYYKDSNPGTHTLTATATDSAGTPYSWTAATQQVIVNSTPLPTATLTAPNLASPQSAFTANVFTSTFTNVSNEAGVKVRVKTTFTLGNPDDIVFDYYEEGAPNEGYLPLERDGNDFYFGPASGFPLINNASSSFRLIFLEPGTYTATSEIINTADGSRIGNLVSSTVVVEDPAVARVSNEAELRAALANASVTKIILNNDITTLAQITVTRDGVTIDGGNKKIDGAFVKTSNSSNSVIGIQANNVTVSNLKVTSSADQAWPMQLHGINVYEAGGVAINKVAAYELEGSGIVVGQGSTVLATNITTSGNGWHGINVDKEGAVLTIGGSNSHDEKYPIFIDDKNAGKVNYETSQYDEFAIRVNGKDARVYRLRPDLSNAKKFDLVIKKSDDVDGLVFAKTPLGRPLEFSNEKASLELLEDTEISAQKGWDGAILAPKLLPDYEIPISGAATSTAITVGSGTHSLLLSKMARLTFAADYGKLVGYQAPESGSSFNEITTKCTENSASGLPDGARECWINDGQDLVVWTKHFTTFATYSKGPSSEPVSTPTKASTPFVTGVGLISPLLNNTVLSASAIATDKEGDLREEGKVLGTDTDKNATAADQLGTIAPSEEGWKLWGVAWYWYLLAIGALGAGGWYGLKLYRNREADF